MYPRNRRKGFSFKTICSFCKKEINLPGYRWVRSTYKIFFCSKNCQNKHQIGRKHKNFSHPKEKNPNYRGGFFKECEICKKLFWVLPHRKSNAKFCSKKCQGITKKGELNWNWVNGKSLEIYPTEFNKNLKDKIRNRDNCQCQLCGVSQMEYTRKFAVHHIDYDKCNLEENNLTTVCNICHNKLNHNREFWKRYFQNKILERIGG